MAGGSRLPAAMILGADGQVITEELAEFAVFSAAAEKMWVDFRIMWGWDEGKIQLDEVDWMKLAATAIGANYHAAIDELNALKLITSANLITILAAIVDVPTLLAIQDKKKVDGSETESGDGGQD